MRTTLNLDDSLMRQLREEVARQGRTMSQPMESALRLFLKEQRAGEGASPEELPSFDGGGALVDIADRRALYDAMDFHRFPFLEVVDPTA